MKTFSIIVLMALSLSLVSCGKDKDKDSSKSSSSSMYGTKTINGTLDVQSGVIELNGTSYPPNQQYADVMNKALQEAQAKNVQPKNGTSKLKGKFTVQFVEQQYQDPYQYGQTAQQNPQMYQPVQQQPTMNILKVVFYN